VGIDHSTAGYGCLIAKDKNGFKTAKEQIKRQV